MLDFAQPEQTALDPFLDISNAAMAARRCGVAQFNGIKLDEEYLAVTGRSNSAQFIETGSAKKEWS